MKPTIDPGDSVIIDKQAYSAGFPDRWDVVAFSPHPPYEGTWIFRVVGLPGETVSFGEAGLLIDGRPPLRPPPLESIRYQPLQIENHQSNPIPFTVPPDSVFVLGDNPASANDSRVWGAVSRTKIIGKVLEKH